MTTDPTQQRPDGMRPGVVPPQLQVLSWTAIPAEAFSAEGSMHQRMELVEIKLHRFRRRWSPRAVFIEQDVVLPTKVSVIGWLHYRALPAGQNMQVRPMSTRRSALGSYWFQVTQVCMTG